MEVNSHSLFSKWFSEVSTIIDTHRCTYSTIFQSGKLVQKLFDQIADLAEDQRTLVMVLVDEVESLVMRRDSGNSTEPSDSIRAVNAVLTQIDRLRKHPNVLVLTTSNITDALDQAFLDRADFCRYIGNPTNKAAAFILQKAVLELARVSQSWFEMCSDEMFYLLIFLTSGRRRGRQPGQPGEAFAGHSSFQRGLAQRTNLEKGAHSCLLEEGWQLFVHVIHRSLDRDARGRRVFARTNGNTVGNASHLTGNGIWIGDFVELTFIFQRCM